MKIEVGKIYRSLINGAKFKVVEEVYPRSDYDNILMREPYYNIIEVENPDTKRQYSKLYIEHLLIEEYIGKSKATIDDLFKTENEE